MSVQTTISAVHPSAPRRLPRPALRLGRLLARAMQAYADAICVPYTIMLTTGRRPDSRLHERDY